MNKLGILLLSMAAASALVVGCSDETTSTTTTTSSSAASSGGDGGGGTDNFGTMPTYGAQIDRFGRPAINTALNATFEPDMAKKDAAKDAWNADSDSAKWAATHRAEVAKNLAFIDALNGTCGDQILAKGGITAGTYDGLASTLADDRLWVNSAGATCNFYLGVEAAATGLGMTGADCGGRTLSYDIIATSYSALAAGSLLGVDDDITAPDYTGGKAFPYFAAPKKP